MIAERRAGGRDRGDLLSMLIAAQDEEADGGKGMTDQQVRDEAMTLLLAGHETTANALTWTWYLLSQSPDVEAQLHARDRPRARRPPADAGGRRPTCRSSSGWSPNRCGSTRRPGWSAGAPSPSTSIGDYTVPPRAMIFMSPYVMQRDARFFADPERFFPDRWTPEFKAALPKFAYFPFGGGARQCIGEQFAWMELDPAGRDDRAALAAHARAGPPGRAAAPRHAAREARDEDDDETEVVPISSQLAGASSKGPRLSEHLRALALATVRPYLIANGLMGEPTAPGILSGWPTKRNS